jgi:hypothetical protein
LNFEEFFSFGDKIRYYFNPDNRFVEVVMNYKYIEDEIELLVEQIGISLDEFNRLYRLAKKHQL